MNYSFDTSTKAQSKFVIEEYFPAIVEFSPEELNNYFIEFNYKDSDMFELSVHPKTHTLKRFSLTLCNHYEIKEASMCLPPYVNGTITITGPESTECKMFLAVVYTDGLQILLSNAPASYFYKTGQLIFAISEEGEVISVYLTDLAEEELSHLRNELSLQSPVC